MSASPFHAIIIGAGTGGLCLAHGLKRAGISVAVYERDRTRTDGLQGYRVGIDPDGSRALHACLPPELYDTFVATCARPPKYFNMLTERLSAVLSLEERPSTDPVNSEKSVSRMTLRQVLLSGLEDVVHFDKTFARYERHADGKVRAFFEDGTSATGDVLVAADGTNSRVRRQYLPHAGLEDSGLIGITAKGPLTEETKPLLPSRVFEGVSMVFAPKGYSCILHVMEFKWDREGHFKGGIGDNDAELISRWPGLLYDNTRDYIMWGFAASARRLPADVMKKRGDELVRLVQSMTPDWHPNLRRLFELADPASCFPLNIRTSVPVEPWPATNVTLIGDAIHTMTPGRGVGANTALRDAELLCRNLTAAREGNVTLLEAIGAYEQEMRDYGFDAVLESRKQMDGDGLIHRPVIGRAVLAGMRTGMRIVNALPPLKKRMAEAQQRYRGADREGPSRHRRFVFEGGLSNVTLRTDPALGNLYQAHFEGPQPDVETKGNTVVIEYRRFHPLAWGKYSGEIALNSSLPWQIELRGGVSGLTADLSGSEVTSLEIEGGGKRAELTLPEPSGAVPVRISGGAREVAIRRPKGVAARLTVSGGASQLAFDEQSYGSIGGETRLESSDYASAVDRYEIEVSGGASTLSVAAG